MNPFAHMAIQIAATEYHPARHRGMRVTQKLRDDIARARAEGLTYDQITDRLHCARSTVYKVIGNARDNDEGK